MSTFAPPLPRTVAKPSRSPASRRGLVHRLHEPSNAPQASGVYERFVNHQWTAASENSTPVAPEPPRIQAKLRIGGANDSFEREADQIADQVVSGVKPSTVTTAVGDKSVHRKCDACATEEENEERLQRKPRMSPSDSLAPGAPASPEWSGRFSQVRARQGHALPVQVLSFMESRLGTDLSAVRIHDNAESAALARTINARAFTVGRDVFFGAGEFQPHTKPGQRLLAHELVHTLQSSRQRPGAVSHAEGTIRRAPAPEQRIDAARARKIVVDWIASIISAISVGAELSETPHAIARRIVAGPFAAETDGRKLSIEEFAELIASGQEAGAGESLLRVIIRESGLPLSLDQAKARLEAARLAAPLLEGLARPGVASLLQPGRESFDTEGGYAEIEEPIEVPATVPRADPIEDAEAAETAVAPPMNAPGPKANDDNTVKLQGGIAVLSAAGVSGTSAYVPAGSVALGRKSDSRLRSAVEDEARFGLFACFPDLSPIRAAQLLRSKQLTLDIPPVAKLEAHGVSEVTVAMDIPRLETKLEMESRCKSGSGLIELSSAKALGQLVVAMDIVEAGLAGLGGGLVGRLEGKALLRAERKLAKSRARAAKKEAGKQRKAALEQEAKAGKEAKKKKKKGKEEKPGEKGKWGCEDVRCNVYPNPNRKPMVTTCPDRVFGRTPYIHPNYSIACDAAKVFANSLVPDGCVKRHCNCVTKCSRK